MDELDTRIISLLQEDGRASNAGIAREVGVSEGTVRRRLKQLIQEELIRVVALLDHSKLGYASEALVGVRVAPDKVTEVAERMGSLEEVNWVAETTGSFDIFAWTTLETSSDLGIFLRTKIGTIPGVQRTETFVNLSVKKRWYGTALKS